jgi:hypothetical protein
MDLLRGPFSRSALPTRCDGQPCPQLRHTLIKFERTNSTKCCTVQLPHAMCVPQQQHGCSCCCCGTLIYKYAGPNANLRYVFAGFCGSTHRPAEASIGSSSDEAAGASIARMQPLRCWGLTDRVHGADDAAGAC